MTDPVFSADGTLMGNLTGSQGISPSSNSLSETDTGNFFSFDNSQILSSSQSFLSPTTSSPANPPGQTATGAGGAWGNITDTINGWTAKIDSLDPTSKTFSPTAAAATITGSDPSWQSVIPRIAIVILGMIFVAAGLTLFKSPIVIQQAGSAIKSVA